MSDADGPGRREVAHRLFAAEFEDADLSYSESDEERAPNYVVTPSGARVNRLFAVGVLTEVEQVSEDVLRGRVVDPTGAFVLYAGQYQPDEQAFLDRADPPMFVAVTGKARTFQPDDADTVYTSVRPETVSEVDADTRDRWTVDAAERTLDRVTQFAAAARTDARGDALASTLREQGVDDSLAEGVTLALDHYGTTGSYLGALRELALDAARVVAGQRDEVDPLTADPGTGNDDPLTDLAADLEGAAERTGTTEPSAGGADSGEPTASAEQAATAGTADPVESTATESGSEATGTTETAGAGETTEATETPGTAATVESTAGSSTATETETTAGVAGDADESDDIGDFEGGGLGGTESGDDLDDFEPDAFELDAEEREEIEEEYGTAFQSGTEVSEPGAADIETPEAEAEPGAEQTGEPATGVESDPEPEPESGLASEPGLDLDPETEPEPEPGATATGADTEATPTDGGDEGSTDAETLEGDLEDAVVDLMGDLDDGDGVSREELVGAATDRYGVDTGAVEDAVQDALMGGRCYEPDDGTLKPI